MIVGRICEDFAEGKLPVSISAGSISHKYDVAKETALRALRILRECGLVDMRRRGTPSFCKPITNRLQASSQNKRINSLPAAQVLAEKILNHIGDGTYHRGFALPKTTFFCRKYGVSSHTVAGALRKLADDGYIRKSGIKWIVGNTFEVRHSPIRSRVLCVVQENPDSFGDLLSDPIWARFAESFIAEAESCGIEMRHVLFDSNAAHGGLISGMREYSRFVNESGETYLGTLVIPPRSRRNTRHMIQWIHNAATRRTEPVIHLCTSLDWVQIENATRTLRNVRLAVYGDWKDSSLEYSSTGLVVEVLEKLGHTNALFIDTVAGREDREWIESRLMNLRKWADIRKRVRVHAVLQTTEDASRHNSVFLHDRSVTAPVKMGLSVHSENSDRSEALQSANCDHRCHTEVLERSLRTYQPTVIIAPNDIRARRYYHICNQLGIRIPHDISLLSFDNAPFIRPFSISSIDFGMHSLGFKALHCIFRDLRIEHLEGRIWAKPRINHYGSLASPGKHRA